MQTPHIRTLCLCLLLFIGIGMQAQKDEHARRILDRTAAILEAKGGVEITFLLRTDGVQGSTQGSIALKGNKFHLKTPSTITWFDGTTQWSYLVDNQEVNVSTPTPEELQHINPYAFINLYKQGYLYRSGPTKRHKGKSVEEIILNAESSRQEIQSVTLLVNAVTAEPLSIKITDSNKNTTVIEVVAFKKALNLPDERFIFDTKKYPEAEIIDLR